ncbi:single-stranded DNA-binding protein [Candidatus Saganbacteria bacterium CG08_land_8_20_14_0_20_45_16]|uniref:Single-stranded DNA-binding protein n=1 Tax=Candidatus Saganbacteria bacterium CG08_land_8_20_14_0_20_45_16 TaxID=2014293 RepID=A0A2H0XTW7_UNCSA|nr:MAG: single-stranded DNA-binding protein [Candidatus Saganbacteria bacterium CG08_land_8_20_14_0_20_45_16]
MVDEELLKLLEVLPPRVKQSLLDHKDIDSLIEVILDLGKSPEARFSKIIFYISGDLVTQDDIDFVVSKVGSFSGDNRAGIERTLHRISCIRNRIGKIIGLTCRVGRAIYGTNDIIQDVMESNKNLLFLGPPGIGKTTKLREAARILSDQFGKRVVVVDTSNEIGGDGDIPHSGIGRARRMQVAAPELQHHVMIEAVENHMPEVIIVDEIGTELEATACRTIAERGVQLIGTAHGIALENVLSNPTLSDLVGGVQTVILGDEEAKRRHTQKAILERKAPPTFDVAIEIVERDKFAIYSNVSKAIDDLLRGRLPHPEVRVRTLEGKIKVEKPPVEMTLPFDEELERSVKEKDQALVRIFPFGVNRGQLERGLLALGVPAVVVMKIDEADFVLTTKAKARPGTKIVTAAGEHGLPVHAIKKNVSAQIMKFLKFYFRLGSSDDSEGIALREIDEAIDTVQKSGHSIDVNPQNAYIRRLQHQRVEEFGLRSESVGEEPLRRLRIYPA